MENYQSKQFKLQINQSERAYKQNNKGSPNRQPNQDFHTYSKQEIIQKIIYPMINHNNQFVINENIDRFNLSSLIESEDILINKITKFINQLKYKSQNQGDNEVQLLQPGQYIKLLNHQKKTINNRRWSRLKALNNGFSITFQKNFKQIKEKQSSNKNNNNNIKSNFKFQQEDFRYYLMLISHAHYLKLQFPGYYKILYEQRDKYPQHYFAPIEKDIPRTLSQSNAFQQPLRRILITYAIRNPSLLYCQGMNYLVAYLLMNSFSQQDCFWFLAMLIQNILPKNFYKDLGTISVSSLVFNDLMRSIFPQFSITLEDMGMQTSMFLVSWFVCLFTKGFINNVSFFLLSTIILQSRNYQIGYILVSIGLAIIWVIQNRDVSPQAYHKSSIEQNKSSIFRDSASDPKNFKDDFETSVCQISIKEIKEGLRNINLDYKYFMALFRQYQQRRQQKMKKIIQREIQKNSERWLNHQNPKQVEKLNQDSQKYNFHNNMFTLPVCKEQYPVCLHRIQIQKKVGQVQQVMIMTNGNPIKASCIQNYFQLIGNQNDQVQQFNQQNHRSTLSHQNINPILQNFEDCLFYRRPHICTGVNRQQKMRKDIIKKGKLQLENQQIYQKQKNQEKKKIQQRLLSNDYNFLNIQGNCFQVQELNEHFAKKDIQKTPQRERKKIFQDKQNNKKTEEVYIGQEKKYRASRVEDRLSQLSGYFVIDPEYLSKQNIQIDTQNQQEQNQNIDIIQIITEKTKDNKSSQEIKQQKLSKLTLLGGTIKKVLFGLNILKNKQDQK